MRTRATEKNLIAKLALYLPTAELVRENGAIVVRDAATGLESRCAYLSRRELLDAINHGALMVDAEPKAVAS